MNAYQVIGWYKSLPKKFIGDISCISDGIIFSQQEWAEKYLKANYAKGKIRFIENATINDIDYFFTGNRPKCGNIAICENQFGPENKFCCKHDDCQFKI